MVAAAAAAAAVVPAVEITIVVIPFSPSFWIVMSARFLIL